MADSGVYFNSFTVGYTDTYISFMRAVMSNGLVYEKGNSTAGTKAIELFTKESPLIGL